MCFSTFIQSKEKVLKKQKQQKNKIKNTAEGDSYLHPQQFLQNKSSFCCCFVCYTLFLFQIDQCPEAFTKLSMISCFIRILM